MYHPAKIRNKAHIDGLWSVHFFLSLPFGEELKTLVKETLDSCPDHVHSINFIEDEARQTFSSSLDLEHFHVSLSRMIYVAEYIKDRIIKTSQSKLLSFAYSFPEKIAFKNQLGFYANDQHTRCFIALDFEEESTECFMPLIREIDGIVTSFGYDPFYSPPRLHASIAWSGQNISKEAQTQLQQKFEIALKTNKAIVIKGEQFKIFLRVGKHQLIRLK